MYSALSGIAHGDIVGMQTHATPEGVKVEPGPSEQWIQESLVLGHAAAAKAFQTYNEVAALSNAANEQRRFDIVGTVWCVGLVGFLAAWKSGDGIPLPMAFLAAACCARLLRVGPQTSDGVSWPSSRQWLSCSHSSPGNGHGRSHG